MFPKCFGLIGFCLAMTLALGLGCSRKGGLAPERLQPPETFFWCAQPISFSPASLRWRREAEKEGGMLGVRFVLTGGLGECMTFTCYASLADRDRKSALKRLIAKGDSLGLQEFLNQVYLARARTDDALSPREESANLAINEALDRAASHCLTGHRERARADLEDALGAASSYEMTLADILPRVRLRPERMSEPERWRTGYERDTTLAGYPAFADDDTMITPDGPLLYRETFCVVNRCAFKATYQGTLENSPVFDRVMATVRFPGPAPFSPYSKSGNVR